MSGPNSTSGKPQPVSVLRPAAKVEELIESPFDEDVIVAAKHGGLSEDLALTLLRRRDLPAAAIEALTKNHLALKHRKVLLQLAQHQRTPRHVSLPLLRRLFTFELMQLALTPTVAADVKVTAEEVLIAKLETLTLGECISLAKQAPPGVAGALLLHSERAVVGAALQNPRITEASILKSLGTPEVPAFLLSMLAEHRKWSLRQELLVAILRRPEAEETLVRQLVSRVPRHAVLRLLEHARLPRDRKDLLRKLLAEADINRSSR